MILSLYLLTYPYNKFDAHLFGKSFALMLFQYAFDNHNKQSMRACAPLPLASPSHI